MAEEVDARSENTGDYHLKTVCSVNQLFLKEIATLLREASVRITEDSYPSGDDL